MEKKKKIILTSYGLTTTVGRTLIEKELAKDGDLSDKRIFLFQEPYYSFESMMVEACLKIKFKKENEKLKTNIHNEKIKINSREYNT